MWSGLSDLLYLSIYLNAYDLQDNLVGAPTVEGTFEFMTVCQLYDDTVT